MTHTPEKTDAAIQRDVLEELKWDTRVKATDIGVQVAAGVVTLRGTVGSWAERFAAQEAAHRISGVLDVANDVRVRIAGCGQRTDADIARAARNALEWDVLVPHERIRTTVTDGVVTLEGDVACWSQRDDAARCVQNLAGVREVRNLIGVEAPTVLASPQAVRRAIEDTLERRAERAAQHVYITVTDGSVTLSGEVPSLVERNAIEGAARGTPGVVRVDNQLRVQP